MRTVRLVFLCCLIKFPRPVTTNAGQSSFNETSDGPLCRERTKTLPALSFRLTACASCYFYLFAPAELAPDDEWLVGPNDTRVLADVHEESSRLSICSTLTPDECDRWRSCCLAADGCCRRQVERLARYDHRPPTTTSGKPFCPQQWDGFGCWDFTAPERVASNSCPEFIKYAIPSEKSYKECTTNGTWFRHPESQLEWTDYSSCIDLENLKRSTITSIVCNVISLVVLIPSVVIFTCYRPLRIQNRVILHINLFSSFILYGIVTVLWDSLIVLNRIEHDSNAAFLHQNTNGCKFLCVLTRYSRMANFLWMFCEAVYLHRLLVKAFQPPRNLIIFYVIGWGFPWIPVAIYAVLRRLHANNSCWIKPFGYWEWLIYVPNLLALILNFVVLLDILRILVTQVQSHDNEVSSYRRALKATFILVPMFGLQLFLVIYRPPYHSSFGRHYEMIAAFVVNLQGLFVALIFCLVNGEVISHLRRSWQKLRVKIHRHDYLPSVSISMATTHSELVSMTRENRRRSSGTNSFTITNGNRQIWSASNSKMAAVYYERCSRFAESDRISCLATDDLATDALATEALATDSYVLRTSSAQLPLQIGQEVSEENER